MTAHLIGPGGAIEVDNSVGPPIDVTIVGALPTVAIVEPVSVDDGGGSLTVDGAVSVAGTVAVSNLPATQPVSGPLTDVQLRASPVPVSGPATDAQMRAAPLPVSGTVTANLGTIDGASTEATLALIKAKTDNLDVVLSTRTKPADTQKVDGSAVVQPVSGTVGLDAATLAALESITAVGPLTDTQLRAAAVPVSGPVTDTQLRASAVPVSAPAAGFKVKDDYQSAEILADQAGAGAVLTFTFSSAVDLIWVTDAGAVTANVSRVDPFGGVPSATAGIPVFNQAPAPILVAPAATAVKVFAPVGATISVYGYRRT